jgi:hypothetical protein
MQRVLRFLDIYSKLKNKRDIEKKTKKYGGGEIQLAPIVISFDVSYEEEKKTNNK